MPTLRRSIPIAFAIISILVTACWVDVVPPSTDPNASPHPPVVIVETRGGECPQGACDSTIAIEPDGRVHATAPVRTEMGTLPDTSLQALLTEIAQADFAAIMSHPFTGTCPVAFDGQEMIYTFTTATGTERIATCEVEVDPSHPLFVAVAAALAGVAPN